jgi:hypothetical protein
MPHNNSNISTLNATMPLSRQWTWHDTAITQRTRYVVGKQTSDWSEGGGTRVDDVPEELLGGSAFFCFLHSGSDSSSEPEIFDAPVSPLFLPAFLPEEACHAAMSLGFPNPNPNKLLESPS